MSLQEIIQNKSPNMEPIPLYFYENLPWKKYPIRLASIYSLLASLCNHPMWCDCPTQKKIDILKNIESSTYNEAIRKTHESHRIAMWRSRGFSLIYSTHIREKVISVDYKRNQDFSSKILAGEIEFNSIGKLSWDKMNKVSKKCLDRVHLRRKQKIQYKTTSMFPCPKCYGKRAKYTEVQKNSSDEGKVAKFTCMLCGWNWEEHD